jgi:hypothetical protein
MYMGAITIFLFILGLILCKGREKWWLVAATVIAVFLAWGNHFMWFTKLWFDYVPMYNKFRTVSMALTVLQVTLPMLGFYALDRVLKEKYEKTQMKKALYISFGITAGFCALCAIVPGLAGTFVGAGDAGMNEMLIDTLAADRQALLVKDAIRSLVLVACAFVLILWARKAPKAAAAALIFLVWLDLALVGKRYLNSSHFVTPKDFTAHYEPRPVDDIIHQDTDPNYRVLDLSVNTFNDAIQSYHHKCIGGYSPVKLQRYQDLIDQYITSEIHQVYGAVENAVTVQDVSAALPDLKVVSMLNGKYIILGAEYSPVVNPYAYGNCWFVSDFVPAANPDEEIALLAYTDLRTAAVIGDDFAWAQKAIDGVEDGTGAASEDVIALSHYAPNELRYSFSTSAGRAAIFSEIYYPKGWKAWIEPAGSYGEVRGGHYQPTAEGRPVELFRADWMLRGALIPSGEGQLIMRFEPDSYQLGEDISRASSIVLILLLLASAATMALAFRKNQ